MYSLLQIETEYGKGAWSGDIYSDIVAFPGDGKCTSFDPFKSESDY